MTYVGSISYDPKSLTSRRAKTMLEGIGVEVGTLHEDRGLFKKCRVSEEAYQKLDPLWGTFVWYLTRDRESEV